MYISFVYGGIIGCMKLNNADDIKSEFAFDLLLFTWTLFIAVATLSSWMLGRYLYSYVYLFLTINSF